MSGTPAATFDTLFICNRLTDLDYGVTFAELHVFAYLACVLSLFDSRPVDEWEYRFVGTTIGAPYSLENANAAEALISEGLIELIEETLRITGAGRSELSGLAVFESYLPRQRYLAASCDCTLALPLASMGDLLKGDPQLRTAVGLMQSKELLDEGGLALLASHFEGLREAIGQQFDASEDLMIPAAIWLSYLGSSANRGRAA